MECMGKHELFPKREIEVHSEENNFPSVAEGKETYVLEDFIPVTSKMDDRETTESDLNILNNHLGLCHATIPYIKDIQDLCALSHTAAKLIECRRKVKSLPYGEGRDSARSIRTFEVIE